MSSVVTRVFGTLAAVGLALGLSACSGSAKPAVVPSDATADPVVTITVVDNRFDPAAVEIEAGQAVRWVFEGRMEHDVVADDGSFVSELMTTGEYVFQFDDAGDFPYDCSIHPEMTGVVTVN